MKAYLLRGMNRKKGFKFVISLIERKHEHGAEYRIQQ
jgi:hypothetical protein